jgi:hypothetical protein
VAHSDIAKQDVPKQVVIPASLDDATRELEGLGRLLQARSWERAAIVFAWTEPGVPHLASAERTADARRLTITAFAELDITGLRTRESVARYRRAWEMAVDDGQAIAVGPGDEVTLPAREWPPFREEPRSQQSGSAAADLAAQNLDAAAFDTFRAVVEHGGLQEVLRDHPETLERLAQQIAGISRRPVRVEPQPAPPELEPAVPRIMVVSEWDDKATRAIAALSSCLRAEDAGTWTPRENVGALMNILGQVLAEREQKGVVSEELFDFLAEQLRPD